VWSGYIKLEKKVVNRAGSRIFQCLAVAESVGHVPKMLQFYDWNIIAHVSKILYPPQV